MKKYPDFTVVGVKSDFLSKYDGYQGAWYKPYTILQNKNGNPRPHVLINDWYSKNIVHCIPISTQVEKYKRFKAFQDKYNERRGIRRESTLIHFGSFKGIECAYLLQNSFPVHIDDVVDYDVHNYPEPILQKDINRIEEFFKIGLINKNRDEQFGYVNTLEMKKMVEAEWESMNYAKQLIPAIYTSIRTIGTLLPRTQVSEIRNMAILFENALEHRDVERLEEYKALYKLYMRDNAHEKDEQGHSTKQNNEPKIGISKRKPGIDR